MSGTIQPVLDRVDADLDASLERLFELARFDSISTDPAYKASCRKAAEWLATDMKGMGFDAAIAV